MTNLNMAEPQEKSKRIRLNLNHIERSRWRRGMAADPNISSSAFRLASVIEDLMNHTSGEAFAGQDELAALSAVSARQVRQHLEALAAAGWIIVLSGRDRTRPRSKRGLHYRPAWPDEETKARCMAREYVSAAEVKSGGKPPVLSERKTGDPASQNRKSSVSKAAENRRFHSNDRIPTNTGGGRLGGSAQGDIISSVDIGGRYKSSPRRAFAYAGPEENDEEIILPSEAGEINIEDMPPLDSPDHEFYNGPERGDLVGIGCGASIPLLAEAEIDAGTPRDPDALTGDRREDEPEIATPDPVAAWLRENAHLIANARKQSPIAVARAWAMTAAREIGFDAETARTMLSAALQQAIGNCDDDDADFIHLRDDALDADQHHASIGF
ncbi:helix-turn-helix domain-containing protein [Brucella pseudintermedia]|uniref:helix-turn-helix domain-containing protein n=1 Tax=Brucella pseudintermedia TaxID=370111 RepID=UPI00124EF8A9|nr:helix-turn-helix domain-containing protein [Brucella pseudintermedia]KAB2681382.1 hypothetical protein F9K78_14530 [Brucella pseudintermedia]